MLSGVASSRKAAQPFAQLTEMSEQLPEPPAARNADESPIPLAPKRTRRWALFTVLGIVFLPVACGVEACATRGRAAMNVELGGLDVSRHDTGELSRDIEALEARLASRKLKLRIAERSFDLRAREVGLRVDRAATLARALEAGRSPGIWARFQQFVARCFVAEKAAPVIALDSKLLAAKLAEWSRTAIADPPVAGDIERKGATFVPRYEKAGTVLGAEAERAIATAFGDPERVELRLPTRKSEPERAPRVFDELAARANALVARPVVLETDDASAPPITLSSEQLAQALHLVQDEAEPSLSFSAAELATLLEPDRPKLERDAVDAKFEVDQKDKITITPSQPGLRIDFERLPSLVMEAARGSARAPLPRKSEPLPKLSTEQAEALGIKGLVSSFTTRHPCCERRVQNIHRIADLLNGRVVMPGETVSLNTVVGPRTAKNGFVPAPTIEEGEMVDTPGGGISQFTTTIFNALFYGGYAIVERQPKPDLIFTNDTSAGLLIKAVYTDTTITLKLYGDNGGRKVRAKVSERTNITQPALTLEPNPKLEPNEEKVRDGGMIGWSVIVSRFLTLPDGTTREEKRKVTYKPKPRRVEVHPCRIPKGEKGYTGERCPEPKDAEIVAEESSSR
jgi:vancomycin resistance protein YoaR